MRSFQFIFVLCLVLACGRELPKQVIHEVPFTSQAPGGKWDDPVLADGCEEAVVLMVASALGVVDSSLDADFVIGEIYKISSWEVSVLGSCVDAGVYDTARILSSYCSIKKPLFIDLNIYDNSDIDGMRESIADGNILIVPINGQLLNHPYYTPPGPLVHMVLVIGYDDNANEFIINDPGTSRGEKMRFSYNVFFNAMGDYETGDHITKEGDDRPKRYITVPLKFRYNL